MISCLEYGSGIRIPRLPYLHGTDRRRAVECGYTGGSFGRSFNLGFDGEIEAFGEDFRFASKIQRHDDIGVPGEIADQTGENVIKICIRFDISEWFCSFIFVCEKRVSRRGH